MQTKEHVNNHQTADYDAVLDKEHGRAGTPEREEFRREAYAWYMSRLLHNARKSEKVTQQELASRLGLSKSYISKIETGAIEPGAGIFYRIIDALGLRMDIVKPVC
jgi:DNA-binding XRE family transcriptional regulator